MVGVVDSYSFVQFIKPLTQDTTDGKEALMGYYFNWITVVSYLLLALSFVCIPFSVGVKLAFRTTLLSNQGHICH